MPRVTTASGRTRLAPEPAEIAGDPFMSQLLGLAGGYSQPQSMVIKHYVNQTTSAYVNDNWKVSPRLSLQLGLRYDALPHAWERNNALENFDPSQYVNTPVDLVYDNCGIYR